MVNCSFQKRIEKYFELSLHSNPFAILGNFKLTELILKSCTLPPMRLPILRVVIYLPDVSDLSDPILPSPSNPASRHTSS
jgi:hypothetical protein